MTLPTPKLAARETHTRIPGDRPGRTLFLRHLPPAGAGGEVVLYVHGGTFPSALSVAYRFDGRSWRDELSDAGFHVWALDFQGFGLSDRSPEMDGPADAHRPLGRAADASPQLERAVRFICEHHRTPRLSIIAHSWGSIVSGHFAGRCPDLVDRMVFFGPIGRRTPGRVAAQLPAWRLISLQDQWDRFTAGVPEGEPPVLSRRHFEAWGEAYLASDPDSRQREPAAVRTPSGPFQDIFDAFAGDLAYDPARVRAPVAIIRGEWDSLCTDTDAAWLFGALCNAPLRRDIKIARATHLMHPEENRYALYRETETFLKARDTAPSAQED
jgi:pimeloyl-ACP methyl ester carboxylesterase